MSVEIAPQSSTHGDRLPEFADAEIVRESYPELQASHCRKRGVPLEDLVF